MTYQVVRCGQCGTLLARHDMQPGSRVEIKCAKCGAVKELQIEGPRGGKPGDYEKRAVGVR